MPEAPQYRFSEAAQLCIVQGRFEALWLGSSVVEPGHLALGILKAIAQPQFERLFPETERFASLCRALGSRTAPAPVSAEDVRYTEGAIAAVAGAHHAAGPGWEAIITPLHVLMGIHRPMDAAGRPAASSDAAAHLEAVGLSISALERLLAAESAAG